MAKLPLLSSLCALVIAIGCSSNPKAEDPSKAGEGSGSSETGDPPEGPGPSTSDTSDTSDTSTAAPSGTVKMTGVENGVPDDYSLVERDCVDLGKKLGDLWRIELRASLSPKLNEKQREKAEESIREGASKKAEDWANGCITSLVGKNVDPKTLKCAFDSKDLKVFEKCLN